MKARRFQRARASKAIYATGWDGMATRPSGPTAPSVFGGTSYTDAPVDCINAERSMGSESTDTLPRPSQDDREGARLRQVDDARRLLDFAIESGLPVSDDVARRINAAVARTAPPTVEELVDFELAYRDLAQFTAPVTAATLAATSDADGRTAGLLARRPTAEAKIWSRKLSLLASLVLLTVIGTENFVAVLTTYAPIDADSGPETLRLHVIAEILHSLEPFTYGAFGAVTFLLKSAHSFIYERSFDRLRIPEYYNRLLLGTIAGGAVKLFVTEVVADDDGQVAELSGAALAFLAGYNNDFLFATLERVAAAILPKVGLDSIRSAGPDRSTATVVQQLLDRVKSADANERATIDRLLDRLVR